MCHTQDALPPTVPLAGLHLSQSCAKAKVRCCCLAAGLNTAHCVSAPSQPQTVPTNVLLIRWLNYSCKNNVDISLKIAVCQILLANLGLQPLLSELLQRPSLPPSLPPADSSPLWFFLSPSHFFFHSFMSQAATQANSERPNGPQINSSGMPIDLDTARKFRETSLENQHVRNTWR